MDKVVKISDYQKNNVLNEVIDILKSLDEEYELEVNVSYENISYVLDCFYDYYLKKGISSNYMEDMINHFNDLAIDAVDNNSLVDLDFILEELKLYELLDSRIEVNPEDTKKIVEKIRKKLIGNEGREHHKKL